jgi:hypothetical protein
VGSEASCREQLAALVEIVSAAHDAFRQMRRAASRMSDAAAALRTIADSRFTSLATSGNACCRK